MEITPQELKAKLDAGEKIKILDVREPEEFELCALKDACLIPLNELGKRLSELDLNEEIVLYCHHGMRSMHAALMLKQKGFKHAKSLHGGIEAWACLIDPSIERY